MTTNQTMNFKKGEEKRAELELPTLHFVVMDQWVDVIGEKALFAWLKMYTWCDRTDTNDKVQDINLWEQSKVKTSLQGVAKRLGVGKGTFYNQILKPLWNVGLIDIEEWTEDPRNGQKAMNITVYKYPQNDKALSFKTIQEIRNYDVDYSSTAKHFAKQKAQSKKEGGSEIEPDNLPKVTDPRSETERPPFSNRTAPRSETEHNNIFNPLYNSLNPLIKDPNVFVNKQVNKQQQEMDEKISKIINEFRLKGLSKELCLRVLDEAKEKDGIDNFPAYLRICLENTLYKHNVKYGKVDPAEKMAGAYNKTNVPFYNWLEER